MTTEAGGILVSSLEAARDHLLSRLEKHDSTRGLYVRIVAKHLIIGRTEPPFRPNQEPEDDDRVRLTHLGGGSFGLSVKRHTGRWEKAPFSGTIDQLVDVMIGTMQHLLADWP